MMEIKAGRSAATTQASAWIHAAEMGLKSIKKRTAEGREVTKNRGVKFGPQRSYTPQQAAALMEMRQRVSVTAPSPPPWG